MSKLNLDDREIDICEKLMIGQSLFLDEIGLTITLYRYTEIHGVPGVIINLDGPAGKFLKIRKPHINEKDYVSYTEKEIIDRILRG